MLPAINARLGERDRRLTMTAEPADAQAADADTDYAPTALAVHTPLAYELEEPTVELGDDEDEHNRRPLPRTLKTLLAAVMIAALGLGIFVVEQRSVGVAPPRPAPSPAAAAPMPAPSAVETPILKPPPPTTVTVTETPQAQVVTPAPPPRAPSRPSPEQQDAEYVQLISGAGIYITNRSALIAGAHDVCAYLAEGHTPSQAINMAVSNNSPLLTRADATSYVNSSIQVYCPQLG
jgi:hypothetical protein